MTSLLDEIPPELFESQIAWLQSRYRVVPLEEALRAVAQGSAADRPLACLTFDDGLSSLYTHAQKILAARQIPASVFVNTGVVGNRSLLWQHAMSYLMHRHSVPAVYAQLARITGWSAPVPETGLGVIQRCQTQFSDVWRSGGFESLFTHFGLDAAAVAGRERPYLERDQIAQMAKNGFTFYSHTASHFPLAHVDGPVMQAEIDSAKTAVEHLPGSSAQCLSFPFGMWRDFGATAQNYALSLGYTVLHVEDGWNPPSRVFRSKTLRRVGFGEQERTDADLYAALELRPVMKGVLKAAAGRA